MTKEAEWVLSSIQRCSELRSGTSRATAGDLTLRNQTGPRYVVNTSDKSDSYVFAYRLWFGGTGFSRDLLLLAFGACTSSRLAAHRKTLVVQGCSGPPSISKQRLSKDQSVSENMIRRRTSNETKEVEDSSLTPRSYGLGVESRDNVSSVRAKIPGVD